MGADFERPFAGRFEAFAAIAFGQPQDADAGSKALFRVRSGTQDMVDQDFGIGSIGRGIAVNALKGPTGVAAMG